MKMRNIISLMLAAIMMLSLCACGAPAAAPAAPAEEAPAAEAPAAPEAPAERKQLRVGMECDYAPNNWQESEATDTNVPIENVPGFYAEGYDVQFARVIADYLDMDLVIVKLEWGGLIEALNQGLIDAIIAGMMDTPERKESINFSDAYHATIYGVMVNNDSPYVDAKSINDFAGAAVLGQASTALDDVIEQMEGVTHLDPVPTIPDMIGRLDQRTCDALVINVENSDSYLATNPNFVVITFEEGNGFELPSQGACVGIRKTDDELLASVNEALASVDQATRDEMWNLAVEKQPG